MSIAWIPFLGIVFASLAALAVVPVSAIAARRARDAWWEEREHGEAEIDDSEGLARYGLGPIAEATVHAAAAAERAAEAAHDAAAAAKDLVAGVQRMKQPW